MLSKLSAAIFILVGSVSVLADDQVSYLVSPETKKLNLPFSDAVRVNNMIFMSGQLGVEPGS